MAALATLVICRSALPAPTPMTPVAVLLAVFVSGKLVVPTPAVTVAPAAVTVTMTTVLVDAPGASVMVLVVVTPLTTVVCVKVVVLEPRLVKVTVALTVRPGVALVGRATVVLMSVTSVTVTVAVVVLLAVLPSGVLLVTLALLVPVVRVALLGTLTMTVNCTVLLAGMAAIRPWLLTMSTAFAPVLGQLPPVKPVLLVQLMLRTVIGAVALSETTTLLAVDRPAL